MQEHDLDLPVTPEITYYDFERLKEVKELLLLNPTMQLQDVTPHGMPDRFTDEEMMSRQKANMLDSGLEFSYNEDELDT
jgi:hypothetical protein